MRDLASDRASAWALTTAAIGSLLASSCCVLPLLLVSVGLTGAWLGHLRVLQPYSPVLLAISVTALLAAGYRIFFSRMRTRPLYRAAFWIIAAPTLILLLMPLIAPWFYQNQ